MITYSIEATVYRATATHTRRELLEFVEAVQGTEETRQYFNVAGSAADVTISFGGLTKVKAIIINAKPEGGVDSRNLLLKITNVVRTGVTAGPHEVPFGSYVIILDTEIASATITNLSSVATDIEVIAIGE